VVHGGLIWGRIWLCSLLLGSFFAVEMRLSMSIVWSGCSRVWAGTFKQVVVGMEFIFSNQVCLGVVFRHT